jgi:hypothetical protein
MFSAIFSAVGMQVINAVLGQFVDAFKAYEAKTVSIEQLRDQLYGVMANAIRDVEVAQAEALAKTYASFMDAMKQSKLMQYVWGFVTISQGCMLLWFQVGIPSIIAMGLVTKWPSSGDTAGWAFALVGACLGMGPLVLKTSNTGASTNIAAQMKGLVSK